MSGSPPPEQINHGISHALIAEDNASTNTCTTVSCIYSGALERYSHSLAISVCERIGISLPVLLQLMFPQQYPDFCGWLCGFGCRLVLTDVASMLDHVAMEHAVLAEAVLSKNPENIWRHVPLVFKCDFCEISCLFQPDLLKFHLSTFHGEQLEKGCQTDIEGMQGGQEPENSDGVSGLAGEEPPAKKIRI